MKKYEVIVFSPHGEIAANKIINADKIGYMNDEIVYLANETMDVGHANEGIVFSSPAKNTVITLCIAEGLKV